MILDKFLEVVELVSPDLFEELNGADARLELDELKKYAPEKDIIRVDAETIHDHYTVTLQDRDWNNMRIVESSEPTLFITLKSGTAPQSKPTTESIAEQSQ